MMFGTPKIGGFILTRDSWVWFWTRLVGIAGLVVSGTLDPANLGLSDKQRHVVMGISAVIMALSSQFSSSNLPSKADAQKVSLPVKEQV